MKSRRLKRKFYFNWINAFSQAIVSIEANWIDNFDSTRFFLLLQWIDTHLKDSKKKSHPLDDEKLLLSLVQCIDVDDDIRISWFAMESLNVNRAEKNQQHSFFVKYNGINKIKLNFSIYGNIIKCISGHWNDQWKSFWYSKLWVIDWAMFSIRRSSWNSYFLFALVFLLFIRNLCKTFITNKWFNHKIYMKL